MDVPYEIHRRLLLAEKMLFYRHIEGCFEMCNEIEELIADALQEGKHNKPISDLAAKERKIRRKLNSIMVVSFRQQEHSDSLIGKRTRAKMKGIITLNSS